MRFRAYLCRIESNVGPGSAGKVFDESPRADLPVGVNPYPEDSEFHSCIYAWPIFQPPVAVRGGEMGVRGGRDYANLRPERAGVVECEAYGIRPVRRAVPAENSALEEAMR